MAAVAAVGAVALVVTAGVVLWGSPTSLDDASANGVLKPYASEPAEAWTLDDASLPGVGGDGLVKVAATNGDDWLISYPAGIKHEYQLINARTGNPRWSQPIDAGFGACAMNDSGQVGCAVRLQIDGPENGFYTVDRDTGQMTRTATGTTTAALVGYGRNFVHVNQTGYQVSMRDAAGATLWSRTFADAAKIRVQHGLLLVDTSGDGHFVLNPADGSDQVSCSQCAVDVYAGGITLTNSEFGHEAVSFYPTTSGKIASKPTGVAKSMRVLRGPSTYPVIVPAGAGSSLSVGEYKIVDPKSGDVIWQLSDPELSKANARPCGSTFAVPRKDRSRVFFNLADGTRRGSMPPPALGDPDSNLDAATCVGSSDDTAVFANPNQITAIGIDSGKQVWNRSIIGAVDDIDGYLVLRQGSTLTALEPN